MLFASCDAKSGTPPASAPEPAKPASQAGPVPTYAYDVVNVFPHDRTAFTEGLVYFKGVFFESTGLNGRSTLRKVDPQSGRTTQQISLSSEYFGEGMTILGNKIYQLTWRTEKGFVYDLNTFELEREFSYTGEGWGLTTDGRSLIMSDGTNEIRFIDPQTFKVIRTIQVFAEGHPLRMLNELEYVRGEIFANVWQTPTIVRIDPSTGRLLGTIDCSGLLSPADYAGNTDVFNGIAYDDAGDRLFVTGKNWPKIFEIQVKPLR
jgi:glutamine cyclotransferase